MNTVKVQYKVKPDRVEENMKLIQDVFQALQKAQPPGLRYASFRMPDGVSFVHIASAEHKEEGNPLSQVPQFQAFVADIKERCDENPAAVDLELVGNYRLLGD